MDISQKELINLVHYNPDTGVFTSKKSRAKSRAGFVLGWKDHGYLRICINRKKEYAHRLAWLYMFGKFPTNKIDHIDGNGENNRLSNLREASNEVNAQNVRGAQKNNSSGFLGVCKKRKKFQARIYAGKQKVIGTFDTPEKAHRAYIEEKRKLHEGCTI